MDKLKEIKEILNLVLTAVLVICALVLISLLMIGFKRWKDYRSCNASNLEKSIANFYLPEVLKIERNNLKSLFEEVRRKPVRGFPIVADFTSIITVGNRKMIFLPILMNETQLYGLLNFGMVDPLKWGRTNMFSECLIGRRSIWFMPIGSSMLYGILIDPQFDYKKVGLGYVVVKRVEESIYDVLLQDYEGNVLFAARGEIRKLNKDIGQGTLIPLKDQESVKRIYKPKWNLRPEEFMLFSESCD